MADELPPFPRLMDLHERHRGLTPAKAAYYAEGAAGCMQRHHESPKSINVSDGDSLQRDYLSAWETPSARQVDAWINVSQAIEKAAYGMAVAAAEAHLGLYVVAQAPAGSCSDYLFGPRFDDEAVDEPLDFEDESLYRLEISGMDHCDGETTLNVRLRVKVEQLARGDTSLPGIAGVVAFNLACVRFRRL